MDRRIASLVAAVLLAVGCGDSRAQTYSDETESGFMASCVPTQREGEEDICKCIYDTMEEEVPFAEFEVVDRLLADDDEAELPDAVNDLVIDCAEDGRREPTTTTLATTTTTEATTTTIEP